MNITKVFSSLQRVSLTLLLLVFLLFSVLVSVLFAHGRAISQERDQLAGQLSAEGVRGLSPMGDVLSAETTIDDLEATNSGRFLVNVPSEFNKDITGDGITLDLGDGTIIAANIISQLLEGDGISVVGSGQTLTIENTDPGSAQLTYGSVRVGSTTLAAGTNQDELVFEAGEGLELTVEDGKVVIRAAEGFGDSEGKNGTGDGSSTTNITNITQVVDDDGLIDTGTSIKLETHTDRLVLGKDVADGKLHISGAKDEIGLLIEAAQEQQANITEWRDANGNQLIYFDNEGNAVFNGTITQNGSQISGDTVAFTGSGSTLVLDIQTDEPNNLLQNSSFDVDLDNWSVSTPTPVNQTENGEFKANLVGWTGSYLGSSFPEEFTNTGFESNGAGWTITGGGLYSISEFPILSSTPYYTTRGPDGNVWYTTTGNKIGKISASGTVTEYTTPSAIGIGQITRGPDNNIWYTSSSTNKIGKITTTGTVTEYSTGAGGGGITAGPDGNIWYTLPGADKVGKITTNGVVLQEYFFSTADSPKEIVSGPDGNLWITFESGNQIGKLSTSGDLDIVTATGSLPRGITVGPDNNIWYVTFSNNEIGKITTSGVVTKYPMPNSGNFDIVTGSDGYLYVTQTGANRIARVSTNGSVTEYGTTSQNPRGITSGGDGNVWYVTENGNKVGVLNLQGPERTTSPTYSASAGSLEVPANAEATLVQQAVNVGDTRQYRLLVHAYIDGSTAVNSATAQMVVNGSLVDTTYTPVGGGWYQLEAVVTGSSASVSYGVRVMPGKLVYLDAFSLQAASTADREVNPSYTDVGAAVIAAPGSSDATFVQTVPFTKNAYTITAYAHIGGGTVQASDVQLFYDGNTIPTTISATGTNGWYQLQGAFTASDTSAEYGVLVRSGKTVRIDSVSLTLANVAASATHSASDPAYDEPTGTIHVNALGRTAVDIVQEVTVPASGTYTLLARLYNNTPGDVGGAIELSDVSLLLNGTPISGSSIGTASNGFFTLSASSFLTPGTYEVGLRTNTGSRLIADALSFQQGSGNDKTVYFVNSGSGLAKINIESTTIMNAGIAENQAMIVTGAQNQVANLSEWKDSNNNVLLVVDEQGRLGIGTGDPALDFVVTVNETTKQAGALLNLNSTDSPLAGVLRLSTGVAASGTDTRFLQFYAGATDETNGTGVGRIRLNNGGVAYESGGADFAEYFASARPGEEYEPGTVLVLDDEGTADTTVTAHHPRALGVVSDTAAFVGNARPETEATGSAHVLVGIHGQMDVQVATIGGTIRAGDPLTTSPIEGHAMKANDQGMILGVALEDFEGGTKCERSDTNMGEGAETPDTPDHSASKTTCGRIRVYVKSQWLGYPVGQIAASELPGLELFTDKSHLWDNLNGSPSATLDGGLTVGGTANVYDLAVVNSISSGQLQIQGLTSEGDASIDTLTGKLLLQSQGRGAIEFMGNMVRVTKEGNLEIRNGVLIANDQFSGSEPIASGSATVRVERSWDRVPSSVTATAEFNGNVWITDRSTNGFTIHLDPPPKKESRVHWQVLFHE
ncbi:MAG: virginiamycin B lyase family protein [Patescibacteria group bacterium]